MNKKEKRCEAVVTITVVQCHMLFVHKMVEKERDFYLEGYQNAKVPTRSV